MDDVAAAAAISKQTIYTHFSSKEELFADLVLGNTQRVEAFAEDLVKGFLEDADVEAGLRRTARRYLALVSRPEALQLRRLVLAEAGRFPDLARTYYERVPERVYGMLASLLADLSQQGRLKVEDPSEAAQHFAWLILGFTLDRAMFLPPDEAASSHDVEARADAGVDVFLAAYGV